MLTSYETERNTGYFCSDGIMVASWYQLQENIKIHMYIDDYEFEVDSNETATPLIKIRLDREDKFYKR